MKKTNYKKQIGYTLSEIKAMVIKTNGRLPKPGFLTTDIAVNDHGSICLENQGGKLIAYAYKNPNWIFTRDYTFEVRVKKVSGIMEKWESLPVEKITLKAYDNDHAMRIACIIARSKLLECPDNYEIRYNYEGSPQGHYYARYYMENARGVYKA